MEKFINSPYIKLLCGIILMVTSGKEVLDSFGDGTIGAHHGVLVFGFVQVLKSIPDFHESIGELKEVNDSIGKK